MRVSEAPFWRETFCLARGRVGAGRFAGYALEPEVRPKRRPDESHVLDRDGTGVEQRHAALQALAREFASRDINFGAVGQAGGVGVARWRTPARGLSR